MQNKKQQLLELVEQDQWIEEPGLAGKKVRRSVAVKNYEP